ncbi:MAG: regulatory protein RecX [Actinobacteria bacterium]|nr:regulatory protein RecX [Actinomycetota bacterium]
MEAPSLDLGLGEEKTPPALDDGFVGLGEKEAGGSFQKAMHKAGVVLSSKPRTVHELRDRLLTAGFRPVVVARVVDRLQGLGLLDDLEFARAWIEERSRRKSLAGAALVNELIAKGIEPEIAEQAVEDAGLDEDAMARALATRLYPRVKGLPARAQVSRLQGALARRGFGLEAVEAGVRSVLPPEGWD